MRHIIIDKRSTIIHSVLRTEYIILGIHAKTLQTDSLHYNNNLVFFIFHVSP